MRPLADADRATIRKHFDGVAKRPAESDISSYGCLASIIGLALLALAPKVLPGLSPALRTTLLVFGGLLVLGGMAFRAAAPAQRVRAAGQRAKRAIDWAADHNPDEDRDRWLGEIVSALTDAFYSGGPWTVHTFDFAGARKRLARHMPTVIAIETLLRLERSIYPVFTEFTSPTEIGPATSARDQTGHSGSDSSSNP